MAAVAATAPAYANDLCEGIDNAGAVQAALTNAVHQVAALNGSGGLGNNMWATIVNAHGAVCLIVNTGGGGSASLETIWVGSRIISAQKANTANDFSLSAGSRGTPIALSTANLYSAVQPGGSLYGLQASNPVDADAAYAGNASAWGTGTADPLVGKKVGGVNVFGGGLAIYSPQGVRLGAIGVSGDTSCTDHAVAWETRHALGLDYVPGGISPNDDDNIVYDITPQAGQLSGISKSGFGHPHCFSASADDAVLSSLPATRKVK